MEIDFNNLDTGEDHSKADSETLRATMLLAEWQKQGRILSKQLGRKIGSWVAPEGVKVGQDMYNTRLYALLYIVRNPELADVHGAFSKAWKEVAPHVTFNNKMTSKTIGAKDRARIKMLCKEEGIKHGFKCEFTNDVINAVKDHYKTQRISELEEQQKLTLTLLADGNIDYNGILFLKGTRDYVATTRKTTKIRLGVIDKLKEVLKEIAE